MFKHSRWKAAGQASQHSRLPPKKIVTKHNALIGLFLLGVRLLLIIFSEIIKKDPVCGGTLAEREHLIGK